MIQDNQLIQININKQIYETFKKIMNKSNTTTTAVVRRFVNEIIRYYNKDTNKELLFDLQEIKITITKIKKQ